MSTAPGAAICTVALGAKYVDLAVPLFSTLADAGNQCVILTDNPAAFPANVTAVLDPKDGTHPWHCKRHVVRAGLEIAETAYWVDADSVIGGPVPRMRGLAPGLWSLGHVDLQRNQRAWQAHIRGKLFDDACARFAIPTAARTNLYAITDFCWALSKDPEGRWATFLDQWDVFAAWLRDTQRTCGDVTAIGFCAHLAGITPQINDRELPALFGTCIHLEQGPWRRYLRERLCAVASPTLELP